MRNLDPVLHPAQPLTVDCSANPYDLRPAVAGIVARVEQVSNHLSNIGSHQKIVVIMGEDHERPSNILLQASLLKSLQEKHQLVFGYEAEHSFLGTFLTDYLEGDEYDLNTQEILMLSKLDVTGAQAIKTHLALSEDEYSQHTIKSLFYSVLQMQIPCVFSDAATCSFHLDKKDPITRAFMGGITGHTHRIASTIHTTSPKGVDIRNRVMTHLTSQFMEQHDVSLAVQQCGVAHLLGWSPDYKFNNSLTHHFTKAGHFVIPVFLQQNDVTLDDIPEESFEALSQGVFIEGLADDIFNDESSSKKEKAFIRKMGAQSETKFHVLTENEKTDICLEIESSALNWITMARRSVILEKKNSSSPCFQAA